MPKVSVIMPCLNMVRYIEECLDSVVKQTLTDIEILVIDAGSSDGTVEILHTYAEKDSRIKLIHSEQRSYGHQVNLGIAAASGEYIGIVDTDDRIKPDMYELLYHAAVESKADYVKGSAEMFYTLENKSYKLPILQFQAEAYGEAGYLEVCPQEMPELLLKDTYLWYGIYRSEFFKQFKLHESPGAAFQDLGGLLQSQINAQKAVYIRQSVYEYRQDNINASIYNQNGFRFVADEYRWAKQFLQGQSAAWLKIFYRKLLLHTMDRFNAMAETGRFWQGAEKDIREITRLLQAALEDQVIAEADFQPVEWKNLQLMKSDPWQLHNELFRQVSQVKSSLSKLAAKLRTEQVIIFGCGRLGTFLSIYLWSRGVKGVAAFCDNQKSVCGTCEQGIAVLSPDHAVMQYPEAQYVVANKDHCTKMKDQLLSFGIPEEQISLFNHGADFRQLKVEGIGKGNIETFS